jgi:hypothetical protein
LDEIENFDKKSARKLKDILNYKRNFKDYFEKSLEDYVPNLKLNEHDIFVSNKNPKE